MIDRPPTPAGRRPRRLTGLLATFVAAAASFVGGAFVLAAPASAAGSVSGFDVSHYQGAINWGAEFGKGARFVYMKATQSTNYVDPTFNANYTNSYNAGFIRGAYHFGVPSASSGAAQADYFIAHGGGWSGDGKTMPPMLDIEYNPSGATCYGLSQASMVAWIQSFNTQMHNRTHKYPMIYTTLDWWTTCTGNTSAFAATNPFFLARYSTTPPVPPAGTAAYTIWQFADAGTFPGDQDRFNGDISQLQRLATNAD